MWKYPCAQVIFDANPAPVERPVNVQVEEMSQAMIRGVMDETGEQFVAYFLPTNDTLVKRARDASQSIDYDDNDEYDYKMARQYHWNVKSKASKGYEENYFIVFRDDAVYYNELETRYQKITFIFENNYSTICQCEQSSIDQEASKAWRAGHIQHSTGS